MNCAKGVDKRGGLARPHQADERLADSLAQFDARYSLSSLRPVQKPGPTCRNQECRADIRGLKSPLHGLRFHDLRHHAITELAESQASDQTIMSIAGHVSPRMLAHYSHVRMEAKRKALDALSGGGSGGSYGTNSDTKAPDESKH